MVRSLVVLLVLCGGSAYAHGEKYPMAAVEYRKTVAKKLEKYKNRLEERMKESSIAEDRRVIARKELATLTTDLNKLVDDVTKDQIVTEKEADSVKERSKSARKAIYKKLGIKEKTKDKEKD
jgi:hypothetical protein